MVEMVIEYFMIKWTNQELCEQKMWSSSALKRETLVGWATRSSTEDFEL